MESIAGITTGIAFDMMLILMLAATVPLPLHRSRSPARALPRDSQTPDRPVARAGMPRESIRVSSPQCLLQPCVPLHLPAQTPVHPCPRQYASSYHSKVARIPYSGPSL